MIDKSIHAPATSHSRFANLFRTEQSTWWKTRRWWIQGLLWSTIMVGMSSLIIFVFPSLRAEDGTILIQTSPLTEASGFVFGSMAPILAGAVIILFQGAIIQERKNGVSAWILSKPVGRNSYILSKALSGFVIIALILVTIPFSLTRILFSFSGEELYSLSSTIRAAGLILLFLTFHLSLTLFLGTVQNSEGAVGGSGIGMMIAFTVAVELLPRLRPIVPWALPGVALQLVNQLPLPSWWPVTIAFTLLFSALLIAGALLRFRKEEIRG
jgi:ABC-2 type transport system permease protein